MTKLESEVMFPRLCISTIHLSKKTWMVKMKLLSVS